MSINKNVKARQLHWNNFPLQHTYDTTGRFGNLIPVDVFEVAPGDFFKCRAEFNMRLSPLSAPAMVRLNLHLHSFYVPYRIITDRSGQESTWEKFICSISGKQSLDEVPSLPFFYTSNSTLPSDSDYGDNVVAANEILPGSLWDYLTLPVYKPGLAIGSAGSANLIQIPFNKRISALPHLACLKIWNDWYRRDQIEEEVVFPLNLGLIDLYDIYNTQYSEPEDTSSGEWKDINYFLHQLMMLRTRNYERDYFTSGLPEPQYGDDVQLGGGTLTAALGASMALNATEPIRGYVLNTGASDGELSLFTTPQPFPVDTYPSMLGNEVSVGNNSYENNLTWGFIPLSTSGTGSVSFGVSDINGIEAVPFSINQLRMAMQLQAVREQINRGGTRYVEIMKSVYGVSIGDLRVMRPVYLGGIKAPITIGSVIQTSESNETPQGTLTGQGGVVGGDLLFKNKHMFEEHGLVITFASVTPRTSYTGGVKRMFRKYDPTMYFNSFFDHLGEQETMVSELRDELSVQQLTDEDVPFAYNPRYQEYKSMYSTATGEFRNTLDNWVLSRDFDEDPTLSPDFIHADSVDFDRLFTFQNIEGTSNEHFQLQLYFDLVGKRAMSKYSTPFTFY